MGPENHKIEGVTPTRFVLKTKFREISGLTLSDLKLWQIAQTSSVRSIVTVWNLQTQIPDPWVEGGGGDTSKVRWLQWYWY